MADEADTTTETAVAQEVDDNGQINTITEKVDDKATEPAQAKAENESKANTDWKAEAQKWQKRSQENFKAAQELDKLKKSQMSEQEKVQAAAAEATERAEAAERRAALLQAAVDHGLTKDDLELLDGVPADQIEDRAKKLATRLKKATPPSSSGSEAGGDKAKKGPSTLGSAIEAALSK